MIHKKEHHILIQLKPKKIPENINAVFFFLFKENYEYHNNSTPINLTLEREIPKLTD